MTTGPLPPIPDPFGLPWDMGWPMNLFTEDAEDEPPGPAPEQGQSTEAELYREP